MLPLSCLGWRQGVPGGELGTCSGQNKPLLLACVAMANGPPPLPAPGGS